MKSHKQIESIQIQLLIFVYVTILPNLLLCKFRCCLSLSDLPPFSILSRNFSANIALYVTSWRSDVTLCVSLTVIPVVVWLSQSIISSLQAPVIVCVRVADMIA